MSGKTFQKIRLLSVFLGPAALFFIAFILFPVACNIVLGFTDWTGFSEPRFVGFENYQRLLNDSIFWRAFSNNAVFVGAAPSLMLGLSLVLALLVDSNPPLSNFLRSIMFLPIVVSIVVVGLMWGRVFEPNGGPINLVLRSLGLEGLAQNWLGDKNFALGSVVVVWIWRHLGYGFILLLTGLQAIPLSITEAARIDGARNWQLARYLTIPLLRPVILIVAFWSIIQSLNVFPLVWVMTQGGPYYHTEVLNTYLFRQAFQEYKFGMGSAIATIVLLLMVAVSASRRFFAARLEY
jgi:raffinose/stachyose/melibiose transport system permease protein